MRHSLLGGLFAASLLIAVAPLASAQSPGVTGVRLGLGTDITGGVAYGAQIHYVLSSAPNAFELGLALFGGTFTEDSNNGFNDYHEETKVVVVGALANYLFRYEQIGEGPYFVAGAGVGAISVNWEETSPTDVSLGAPLPGGGSSQSEDGTTGGVILNFGVGYRVSERFDLRAQVPTFFIGSGDYRDSAVVPTFTLTAGLNFN